MHTSQVSDQVIAPPLLLIWFYLCYVLNCLDKHCVDLFIDLSKAFDTVHPSLFTQGLSSISLDPAVCSWFKKDLKDRMQCVFTDCVKSGFLDVTKGVPQRSLLGLVLFTIYINNIGLTVKK